MYSQFKLFHGGTFRMRPEAPLRLDAVAGELAILSGDVWLTRLDDPVDHMLGAGARMRVEPRQQVVVQAWERSDWPTLRWLPDADATTGRPLLKELGQHGVAAALRGLAWLAGATATAFRQGEAAFAAVSRSAAQQACRATPGCA